MIGLKMWSNVWSIWGWPPRLFRATLLVLVDDPVDVAPSLLAPRRGGRATRHVETLAKALQKPHHRQNKVVIWPALKLHLDWAQLWLKVVKAAIVLARNVAVAHALR